MNDEPTRPGQEADETIVPPALPPSGGKGGVAPVRALPLEYSPQAACMRNRLYTAY